MFCSVRACVRIPHALLRSIRSIRASHQYSRTQTILAPFLQQRSPRAKNIPAMDKMLLQKCFTFPYYSYSGSRIKSVEPVIFEKFGEARLTEADGIVYKTLYHPKSDEKKKNNDNIFMMQDFIVNKKISLIEQQAFVRLGIYQHYKLKTHYRVIGHAFLAHKSDIKVINNTISVSSPSPSPSPYYVKGEWHVIYQDENQEPNKYWARPLSMFKENVNGVSRFKWIEN